MPLRELHAHRSLRARLLRVHEPVRYTVSRPPIGVIKCVLSTKGCVLRIRAHGGVCFGRAVPVRELHAHRSLRARLLRVHEPVRFTWSHPPSGVVNCGRVFRRPWILSNFRTFQNIRKGVHGGGKTFIYICLLSADRLQSHHMQHKPNQIDTKWHRSLASGANSPIIHQGVRFWGPLSRRGALCPLRLKPLMCV